MAKMTFKEVLNYVRGETQPLQDLYDLAQRHGCAVEFVSVSKRTIASFESGGDQPPLIKCPVGCHAHVVYHELLHLKIFIESEYSFFNKIPAEFNGEGTKVIEKIKNSFCSSVDHAWFGSAEINAYPEAKDYWCKRLNDDIWPLATNPPTRRAIFDMLTHWLTFDPYRTDPYFSDSFKGFDHIFSARGFLELAADMTTKVKSVCLDRDAALYYFEECLLKCV